MVNWDNIKRLGEQGMLVADETDALVKLGKLAVRMYVHDHGCDICGTRNIFTILEHNDGCPVKVLTGGSIRRVTDEAV